MGEAFRVRPLWVLALVVGACSPDAPVEQEQGPENASPQSEVTPAVDAAESVGLRTLPTRIPRQFMVPPEAAPLTPPAMPYPRECADIYDDDLLPTYEIEISEGDWRSLEAEYAAREFKSGVPTYFPITFKYGGETITDARIKLRGNNSDCDGKMQFAISFNQVRENGRFHGLRRINLDHAGCRIFEERLAMSFARDLGLPYVCVNHARLEVNGRYYGLFVNLEHQNKDFLKRNFAEDDGNLYKRDRELKTNEEENNTADIEAYRHASGLGAIEKLVDLDQAIAEWAFEAVIIARDNYWMKGYNYMLYSHPQRGFIFLPNDMDQAVPSSPSGSELNNMWPATLQFPANIVLADADWRRKYEAKVSEAARAYDADEFEARLDRWWAQVRSAAEADPFIGADVKRRFDKLKEGVRIRGDYVKRWR